MKQKRLWLKLALINLAIVALLGMTLRSKILFSIPFLDYRNVLSAHSHFAFGGWAGLSLITLLIYDLLPVSGLPKRYLWMLLLIEVSSLGMAFSFPFTGYGMFAIIFSSLYIVTTWIFAFLFITDLRRYSIDKTVTLLATGAAVSLVLSALGPFALSYIMATKSNNAILYRDSIYTFLHFQYNGFFTLSVFTLLLDRIRKQKDFMPPFLVRFSRLMVLSIIPALFLSLLWHNNIVFYIIASLGAILLVLSLFNFLKYVFSDNPAHIYQNKTAKRLFQLSLFSFAIKMILHLGTLYPPLANEVFGDRPVIIGFLHLVFLGFISFFVLSTINENEYLPENSHTSIAIIVFSMGILLNELILGLQGLGVLFKTNSTIFNWLLWGVSIILFTGGLLLSLIRLKKGQL